VCISLNKFSQTYVKTQVSFENEAPVLLFFINNAKRYTKEIKKYFPDFFVEILKFCQIRSLISVPTPFSKTLKHGQRCLKIRGNTGANIVNYGLFAVIYWTRLSCE
jgi:hypothetical protein